MTEDDALRQAVEVAALALYVDRFAYRVHPPTGWGATDQGVRDAYRQQARVVLESVGYPASSPASDGGDR